MHYPKLEPIPIPTKHKLWYRQLFIWLFQSRKWRVVEDYELYIPWLQERLKIPEGFVFDGASIPKIFWPLLSPTGILFIPALFHDFAYRYNFYLNSENKIIHNKAGKGFFDKNFRKMGVWINDMPIIDTVAQLALGLFGFKAWRDNRKKEKDSIKFIEEYLAKSKTKGECDE